MSAPGPALVREATAEDWPAIWPFFAEIVRAGETLGYDRDMSEAQARAMWLDGPPSRTVVAEDGAGRVTASANLHRNRGGPGAHIASATFIVDPSHQGRGIGRGLVREALDWAAGQGFRGMQFNAVVETNRPAVSLYESMGFEVVGSVPGVLEGPGHGFVALLVMFRRI